MLDDKTRGKLRILSVVGIIVASIIILVGVFFPVKKKHISYYSYSSDGYEEYVGGDAYNYIIEASLRGGQIAGQIAMKSVFIVGGAILLFGSAAGTVVCRKSEKGSDIKTSAADDRPPAYPNDGAPEDNDGSKDAPDNTFSSDTV